jgi:hypothetical protein
MRRVFHTTVA